MANAVDKEQIDMLKTWWHNYGKYIAIAILIGLAIGLAWRYYHQYRNNRTYHASMLYQQLQVAAATQQAAVAPLAATLTRDFPKTPYATLAALVQAKMAVKAHKLDQASERLRWVIKNSSMPAMRQIARLRLARLLSDQKQYQAAVAALKPIEDKAYQAMITETRGDIYYKMGQSKQAQKAYKLAQQQYGAANINNPYLNMKISQ